MAQSTAQDSIYLDRFGNSYDRLDVDGYFNDLAASRSVVGYFDIRFDITNQSYKPVIEDVFEYISTLLEQRSVVRGCSEVVQPSLVRILIKESSTVDDPAQATGSPYYYTLSERPSCDEVILDRVNLRMNGGLNDQGIDGIIKLNDDPDFDWYLGTGSPSSTQIDLYTIVLHEALHVFGFAPRVTANTTALDGVYSLWDQLIYTTTGYVNGGPSLNMAPLLTSDCAENCWSLNTSIFATTTQYNSALAVNCSTLGSRDFVFGDNAIAPLVGGSSSNLNSLAHLNQTCNGQNISYVMLPGISLAETRRTITTPELNILCELGYVTSTCDECFLTVLSEDPVYSPFESCCEIIYTACEDEQVFIDFEDLMCNDESSDFTDITDYYVDSGSPLLVNVTSTGFEVTPTLQGNHILHYTVRGCDCRLLNGQVRIFTGPCTDCELTDPCDNLVCVDDFEEFNPGIATHSVHIQALGNIWLAESGDNSLDICQSTTGNNYLHIGSHVSNREGLIMKLSESLDPGCTLHVTFDASVNEKNTFQWYVSEEAPCNYNNININSAGLPVDCGTHEYEPFHIRDILIANVPTTLAASRPCADVPNLITYDFSWVNEYDIEVNYLILFPGPKNNLYPNNYFDNIYVTKDCLQPRFTYEMDGESCLAVDFIPSFLHSSVQHDWDFGDTNDSQQASPTHTYSSGGSFTVTHTVSDDCGNSATSSQEITLDCCNDFIVTTPTSWTVGNPIPNNGIFQTLTIAHGASLNIGPGVVLKFCPNGSTIVEEGAYLRNLGTLTSLGDFAWQGVYVTGIPTINQFSNCSLYNTSVSCIPQGFFWADDGSMIENAIIGIRNYGPGFNEHGGIIKATEGIFRNNQVGVDFKPYENFRGNQPSINLSTFTECIFETTVGYELQTFTHFIKMDGVNGIRIVGCDFDNNIIPQNAQHYEDFGRGIYANNSGFKVSSNSPTLPCLPPTVCGAFTMFDGLGHGIFVTNTTGTRPYSIVQAEFTNTWRNITLDGASGGTVLFNTINFGITPTSFNSNPEDQIGIQLEGDHTGFQIQENTFDYNSGGVTNTIGIRCHDIGTANNIIRRNYFDGLDIVHEAFGINALNSEINSSGLVFLCEDINNTQQRGFDFYIPNTGGLDNIYYIQGEIISPTSTLPTGTEFAYTATDIQNDNGPTPGFAESIFYNWYDAGNQEPLTGTGYIKYEKFQTNTCTSSYCMPPCITGGNLTNAKSNYHGFISQLNQDITDYWTAVAVPNLTTAATKNASAVYQSKEAFKKSYDIVQYYWHDTVTFNFDTLLLWYSKMNSFGSDIMIGGEIANKYGFNLGIAFLEDIPLSRTLSTEQQHDLNQIITVYDILDRTDLPNLSSAQKDTIRSIAQESRGRASGIARGVLHYFGEKHPLPYFMGELYDPPLQQRSMESDSEHQAPFVLQPMPAREFVIVQWNEEQSVQLERTIYLSNLLGQPLITETLLEGQKWKQLNISNLPSGIYLVTSETVKWGKHSSILIKD